MLYIPFLSKGYAVWCKVFKDIFFQFEKHDQVWVRMHKSNSKIQAEIVYDLYNSEQKKKEYWD